MTSKPEKDEKVLERMKEANRSHTTLFFSKQSCLTYGEMKMDESFGKIEIILYSAFYSFTELRITPRILRIVK